MQDLLEDARERFKTAIADHVTSDCGSVAAGPWIISSLLQKSIRRGETAIAQRAALTFLNLKGSAIWRRLTVIAFEDVGVGSIDAVTAGVAASSDAAFRKACGGNERVAIYLASVMAKVAKDRSADFICGAKDHPNLASSADALAKASLEEKLASVRDHELALPKRAIAALLALVPNGDGAWARGDADRLLGIYRELNVPEDLLAAIELGAARTREPITFMLPLLWLAVRDSKESRVLDCPVPPLVKAGDVPLYSLDEHTRLGREAIWRFASENDAVRACLERFVPAAQRRRAAHVAAFYVDAAPVARRLIWDQSDDLEAFGRERDLMRFGVAKEGIAPLIAVMRANLDHLNALRADVFTKSHPARTSLPATPRFAR